VPRAVLACGLALAIGLGIGLIVSSGTDAGAAGELRPAGVKLERLATPSVGAIAVPALKVRRMPTRTGPVTPPPPPPVTPVPPPVLPPPPPVVAPPPPPPPIIVVPG